MKNNLMQLVRLVAMVLAVAGIIYALEFMERGIAVFDTAVAGLGGCPYAKGASGNVGTEDVIYLMNGLGIEHGVDLDAIAKAGREICVALGREPASKVARDCRASLAR